jgi:hypothetical protein
MQSRAVLLTVLFAGVVTAAPAVFAQTVKPTVAPAPLVMVMSRKPAPLTKRDIETVTNEFERLVRAAGARIPTPSEIAIAVAALERKDFAASDDALAELARKVQTLYAVHVQLEYTGAGTVVGLGRVVRADGKRMEIEVRVERSPEARPWVKASLETLIAVLEKLELQRLPSAIPAPAVVAPAPVAAPPVVVSAPAAAPAPLEAVSPSAPKQPRAGKALLAGGAAIAIGGMIVLGLGAQDSGRLTPDANQNLPADQAGLYRRRHALVDVRRRRGWRQRRCDRRRSGGGAWREFLEGTGLRWGARFSCTCIL